jgi:putative tryptophan/tyrosine transport system substrate-binding protein
MRRRDFIMLLGSTAAAWPLTTRAQQSALPVIGFLNSESREVSAIRLRGFHQGLSEAGYVEGRNVVVEYRWADGQYERLPALATDLARRQMTLIAANGPAALPAKAATNTIPTVFFVGGDPVAMGLVVSQDRPGGNLTGVMLANSEPKPYLVNPSDAAAAANTDSLKAAADHLGWRLQVLRTSTDAELDAAFEAIGRLRPGGLMIASHPFVLSRIDQLGALILRQAAPAISQYRELAAAGALISYGPSPIDGYRLLGLYSGRILKGEKTAELPVMQPRFELTVNLKTAKALGLTVPPSLLARADEVIE